MQEGRLALAQGDRAAALESFREAAAERPEDAEAANSYAQLLVRSGNPTDAVAYLERAVTLEPAEWAYRFNLARCYGLLDRWEKAVAEYRAAAGLFPADYATHFNLALALHRLGDEEGAAVEYMTAVAIRPDEPSFHLALGQTFERLGRKKEADEAFRKYIELAPENPEAETLRSRLGAVR